MGEVQMRTDDRSEMKQKSARSAGYSDSNESAVAHVLSPRSTELSTFPPFLTSLASPPRGGPPETGTVVGKDAFILRGKRHVTFKTDVEKIFNG